MPLDLKTQSKAHSIAERGADLYETPPEAIAILRSAISLPRHIWEPTAGRGAISSVLIGAGHTVTSTELHEYDSPRVPIITGIDFFTAPCPREVGAIVTNPPYSHGEAFVRRAREIAPMTCVLMRLAFVEGVARQDMFKASDFVGMVVSSRRLPMMHRDGWAGPRASSAMPFAWFVWKASNRRRPILLVRDWKALPPPRGILGERITNPDQIDLEDYIQDSVGAGT